MARVPEIHEETEATQGLRDVEPRRIMVTCRRELELHHVVSAERVGLVNFHGGVVASAWINGGQRRMKLDGFRVDRQPVLHAANRRREQYRIGLRGQQRVT